MEDLLAEQFIKTALRDHLNSAAQKLFEVSYETAGKPRARLRSHFDQQIDVAFGTSIASGHRTENANSSHAMATRHSQDLLPFPFDNVNHAN